MDDDHLPAERMRASDADRDATAERLAHALSEGRLDLTEYDERLSAAMGAKTMGELARLTDDLPAAPGSADAPVDLAEVGAANTPVRGWRERLEPWRGFAGISIILIGVWAVSSVGAGQLLTFWPAWPLSFMLIITAVNAVSGSGGRGRGRSAERSGDGRGSGPD
ncbi:DUF1707 domain-containing protein [Thermobifida halotolerans]|uniref:DUF1707 domain-containing protein n=1 Tax=Thermobifida halotolerans TaxID=483545 RepID=A0A399G3X8_9ACTN|nr:DUF1707 domain-containing protein [Thermobifida halotolerans]UOE17818.1 DUF1707 domain-containing protein [Thermobifida halotolerans]